jgi:hypothetical protein
VRASETADRSRSIADARRSHAGVIGLGLLLLGRDPFAHLASDRALDGIGIVGAFIVLHVAVAVALLFDGTGARRLQSIPQG